MNIQAITYRKILLAVILVILLLPFLQGKSGIVLVKDLNGWEGEKPVNTGFSFKQWFAGEYQEKKDAYVSKSFGFRNIFIRINNQLAFDLFNKALANGVIIGKQNYLYENNYLKAYYGQDFIGKDSILYQMQKLKSIQDTLAKLNKTVILIFAAGKGSFYPEYFPDNYKSDKKMTNYEYYAEVAKKLGINYIDFNKYFVENKNKSKYPLYPQYGIHWSTYGECLAADSLVKYIEKARNIKMPHIYWDSVAVHYPADDTRDDDIEDGMNLLFSLKQNKMAYPVLRFQSDTGKQKPSAIVVADSYYWGMFNFGISRLFSDSHFWFYNQQVYPDSYTTPLNTSQLNLRNEIEHHDVFIIMATEATLPKLGWGFIEDTYKVFAGNNTKNDSVFLKKVKDLSNYIRTDKTWLANIKKDAREKNISLDSAITLNAIWVVEHDNKK